MPTLASTNDYIYAYWGCNTSAPAYTTNGTAWSNGFAGVWHLNEGGTSHGDSTTNGNTAVSQGDTVNGVSGKIGGAVRLDGNGDYLTVPHRTSIALTNNFTVETWVKRNAYDSFDGFVSKSSVGVNGWNLNFNNNSSKFAAYIASAGYIDYDGAAASTDYAWHHMALRLQNGTAELFFDGQKQSVTKTNVAIVESGLPMVFGAFYSTPANYLTGLLDEIRLSRVARSTDWIYASWLNQASNASFVSYAMASASLTVQADAPSSITMNGAIANGTVIHTGKAENPQVSLCWDNADKGTNVLSSWLHVEVLGTNWGVGQAFSTNLTGLISGNAYTYRCYVTNSTGQNWSEDAITFTVPYALLIQGSPANYGNPLPNGYGTSVIQPGTTVTNAVVSPTNATATLRRTCIGWNSALLSDGSPVGSGVTTQAVVLVTNNLTLTWNWTNECYLTLTNSAGGTNEAKAGWYNQGVQVAVTAFPTGAYHFIGWVGDVPSGGATNNPITVTLDQAKTLKSQFSTGSTNFCLVITGSPVPYSGPSPLDHGTFTTIPDFSTVTNSMLTPTNTTTVLRRACVGWTLAYTNGTALTSDATTQAVFQLNASEQLTWLWTNEYYLSVGTNTGGTSTTNVSGWYRHGTQATVRATATGSYTFLQWMGNVPAGSETDNPLTLTMDQARAVLPVFVDNAVSETKVWSGSNNWYSGTNWTPAGVPGPEDDVLIRTGTVVLAGPTRINSLLVSNSATLTFINWNSRLAVAGQVTIRSNGLVTLPASFTDIQQPNNIYMACNAMTIDAGGRINADTLGYLGGLHTGQGYGPGRAVHGASYGGWGGGTSLGSGPYGSAQAPVDPGSGGGGGNTGAKCGGDGGGAIRLEVEGVLSLEGAITANGQQGIKAGNGVGSSGGSGGSIFITCGALDSSNGTISANGGARSISTTTPLYGGGGGRIALCYTNDALQAAKPRPTMQISANDGYSPVYPAQPGTIYFSGSRVMPEVWNGSSAQLLGPSTLEVPRLTFVTNWIQLSQTGMLFKVTDSLTVIGSNVPTGCCGRLDLMSNVLFQSGGDVVLTNGGTFYVYSVASNLTAGVDYGALVMVGGSLSLCSNSWLYPISHTGGGGSPLFRVRDLLIQDPASGIDAYAKGYPGGGCQAVGTGPGRGYGGASYGGRGGNNSTYGPYGSSNAPIDPGSGGSGGNIGGGGSGTGGGVIRFEAQRLVWLNGSLNANGGSGLGANGSAGHGGSGGSIYLTCGIFDGSSAARLLASGGNGGMTNGPSNGGFGGGGGRIAIWSLQDFYTGGITCLAGTNYGAGTAPANGTVVRGTSLTPCLISNVVANVAGSSADLVGRLSATGASPTYVYCYWGKTDGGYRKENWPTNDYLGARGVGQLTNRVNGLEISTLYYYRFYATNALGEMWAPASGTFTTAGGSVLDNSAGATALTPTSAVLHGTVVGGDPAPEVSIFWGPTDGGTPPGTWSNRLDLGTLVAGSSFSNLAVGMWANQTNYYRCYGTNVNGTGSAPSSAVFRTLSPTVTVSPTSVMEGNPLATPNAIFTLSLSAPSAIPVSVDYFTRNGGAVSGVDYVAASGMVAFAVGVTNVSVAVTVSGDLLDEYPSENFFLVLTNAAWVYIGTTQAEATIWDDDYGPDVKTWSGAGDWMNGASWTPVGPPSPGDIVLIPANSTCMVSTTTANLAALTNNGTLIATGWNTAISAATVVVNGTLTHTVNSATTTNALGQWVPDSRLWVVCTDLAVNPGGRMDADARGYRGGPLQAAGYGPGRGNWGASYGGWGGRNTVCGSYGLAAEPTEPGSGGAGGNISGGGGGNGGGAIRIDAGGVVSVFGSVTANGQAGLSGNATGASGGSGGSIFITCAAFAASNATIGADGGDYGFTGNNGGAGGSGGRIAILYTNDALQAAQARPVMSISAKDGACFSPYLAGLGTLYLSGDRIVPEVWNGGGQWLSLTNSWQLPQLMLQSNWVQLVQSGMSVRVNGSITLVGTNVQSARQGKLEIMTNVLLQCGGGMTLSNGATLYVYSGATNATFGTNYGALVTVDGSLSLNGNSWIYPYSHGSSGAGALFKVGKLQIVDANSGINADAKGYGRADGPGRGNNGGSYGGWGGGNSVFGPYGSTNMPIDSGSGGASGNGPVGGSGGGIIRIESQGSALINGKLTANGWNGEGWNGSHGSGGSGGSIYLSCLTLKGADTGLIRANGGDGGEPNGSDAGGYGGSGGRIWIGTTFNTFAGQVTAFPGTNYAAGTASQSGTLTWVLRPAVGTSFIIR